MFVFVWGYVHCVPMEDRDPWELELQAVLSCPMWVLGTKLRSSRKAGYALNH